MSEFLLEILAEEIPAGVLSQARNDLLRGLADALAAERIDGTFFAHSTSRRLVLFSRDLPEVQEDHEVEAIGPSVKVAYDAEGRPTRAAEGFARSNGLTVDQLTVEESGGRSYVVARKRVATLTPIKPRWLPRRGLVGVRLAEPSARWDPGLEMPPTRRGGDLAA